MEPPPHTSCLIPPFHTPTCPTILISQPPPFFPILVLIQPAPSPGIIDWAYVLWIELTTSCSESSRLNLYTTLCAVEITQLFIGYYYSFISPRLASFRRGKRRGKRRVVRQGYSLSNLHVLIWRILAEEYPLLLYTTQVNSAFRALWLVNSEVISQYYSTPSNSEHLAYGWRAGNLNWPIRIQ